MAYRDTCDARHCSDVRKISLGGKCWKAGAVSLARFCQWLLARSVQLAQLCTDAHATPADHIWKENGHGQFLSAFQLGLLAFC